MGVCRMAGFDDSVCGGEENEKKTPTTVPEKDDLPATPDSVLGISHKAVRYTEPPSISSKAPVTEEDVRSAEMSDDTFSDAEIVGVVIGGVVGAALVIGCMYLMIKNRINVEMDAMEARHEHPRESAPLCDS